MTPEQIKKLQDSLVKQGYMTQAEVNTGYGIYGPKTTAAMAKYTTDMQKQSAGNSAKFDQSAYDKALSEHPALTGLTTQNAIDSINNAYATGNWSGVKDVTGKPFSAEAQKAAETAATQEVTPYYEAQQQFDTQKAEADLKQQQLDYQNYLAKSASDFETNKAKQDQSAADTGVLFSGGRVQKLQNLQKQSEQDQAYKQASVGSNIGGIARDYQYKYGNEPTNKLSSYYSLGGNTYNPNVSSGGVGSSGLSNVYSTGNYNFQGTQNVAKKAAAQQRAAGKLWGQGNKIVSGGYNNQY